MPLYEYFCNKCHKTHEEMQKFTDKPLTTCPACGKKSLQKQVSQTAFQLKGEGWYKDGYARPSQKPPESPIKKPSEPAKK